MGYFKNKSNVGTATHTVTMKQRVVRPLRDPETTFIRILNDKEISDWKERKMSRESFSNRKHSPIRKRREPSQDEIRSIVTRVNSRIMQLSMNFVDIRASRHTIISGEYQFFLDIDHLIDAGVLPDDIRKEFYGMTDNNSFCITPRCFARISTLLK